jgi:hypothetical protein
MAIRNLDHRAALGRRNEFDSITRRREDHDRPQDPVQGTLQLPPGRSRDIKLRIQFVHRPLIGICRLRKGR